MNERFRLASSIDLSKADKFCPRCFGTGILGSREVDIEGQRESVPVICRCVSRAGGVAPDLFDRILVETQKRLDDGTFGDALADDVAQLPAHDRERAIAGMQAQADREDMDPKVRSEIERAIAKLRLSPAPTEARGGSPQPPAPVDAVEGRSKELN